MLTVDLLRQARQLCYGPVDAMGVLVFSGPDAGKFLQNQTTQDIASLKDGEHCPAAAVDRQGKIQGVFTVFRHQENYLLLLEKVQIPGLVAHFKKFHILEKFEIQDKTDHYQIVTIQGEQAETLLAALVLPSTALTLKASRYGELPGAYVILPNAEAPDLFSRVKQHTDQLNGLALTPVLDETLRIEAGVPKFGVDFDSSTLLPETGLAQETVNYNKGCYLGQEVIARVKTYGALQKALMGLIFEPDAKLPASNSECLEAGKSVGTLKSAIDSPTLGHPIALAYLDKTHRIPGNRYTLTIAEKPYAVEVVALPFIKTASNDGKQQLDQALALFSQGDDAQAIEQLQALITQQPDYADAYEALGVILGRNERVEEAIATMLKLLEVDPDHVLAHTNLSIFYLKLGDKDKAEDEKAKATIAGMRKKAKESGFDLNKLEAEREQREREKIAQLEERIGLFIEALKFSPPGSQDAALGNFGLGSCYVELKRYSEAVSPLELTIAAQPKHSVAYHLLGQSFEALGELEKAKLIYQKGIEVAAAKGDMMPLTAMQQRLQALE